ncbi:hypothetical protein IG631_08345 [Alternaria alternata]|nr:hypothetical protein IG631_08345 [Alternaria alternata]
MNTFGDGWLQHRVEGEITKSSAIHGQSTMPHGEDYGVPFQKHYANPMPSGSKVSTLCWI